jgi:hypothetical protein
MAPKKKLCGLGLSCIFAMVAASVRAPDFQTMSFNPRQTVDVYFEVNLSDMEALLQPA